MATDLATEPTPSPTSLPNPQAGMVREAVARVLDIAARASNIRLDPAKLDTSRVSADVSTDRHPFVALAASSVAVQLSVSSLRAATDELAGQLDEGVTLVVEQLEPTPSWLVFSAATASGVVEGHEIAGGRSRPLRGTVEAVLNRLARTQPVANAVVLEARFPLEVLSAGAGQPMGPFRRLWALAKLEKSELVSVLTYAVFIGLLTLVMPVSVQALVNTIAFGSVLQPLIILGMALTAGLVLSLVLQVFRDHVVENIQQRLFVRMVSDFGRRLPRWSAAAHRTHDPRELTNRFFDVVTLQKSAASLAVDGLGLALQTTIGLVLLAVYHPVLLAFDIALVLALVALIFVPMQRAAKSAIYESKAKYATAAWLQTISAHADLFGGAIGARQASTRAESFAASYIQERSTHWRHLLTQIAGGLFLHVLASVGLLVVGGWLVMQRQLTLGQLVASELVVALVGAGFAKLGKQMEKLYDAAAAVDKVGQVVDVERERDGGSHITATGAAQVEIADVDDPRLAGSVDARIEGGEVVAVAGPTASGKSTLLQMVLGRLTPHEGRVRVDGVDLSRADLLVYRDGVCWLDESPAMPMLTVAELLRLHAPHASTAELTQALDTVGLSHAIERLPNGVDTRLLPNGAPLSKTEGARLALARLLLQKPRLALLDGCLDALSDDAALLDAVLGGPWTTLVATRSEAVMSRAHRTLHLTPPLDEETYA